MTDRTDSTRRVSGRTLADFFWCAKRWVTTDDAGREVRLFEARAAELVRNPGEGVMSGEAYRRLRADIRSRSKSASMLRVFGWLMIVVGGYQLYSVAMSGAAYGVRTVSAVDLGQAVFLLLIGMYSLRWLGTDRKAVEASLRAAGRCASCGYDLRGIEAGAAGRRVCPECRAEWNAIGGLDS